MLSSAIPPAIAAVLASGLTLYSHRLKEVRGARLFALFCASIAVWCGGVALERLSSALEARIFWSQVQHLGIAFTGLLWFLFTSTYTQKFRVYRRPIARIGVSLALLSMAVVWTNTWHGWFWSSVAWASTTVPPVADYTHGWWFRAVYVPYNYLFLALGLFTLVQTCFEAQRSYRNSLVLLVTAGLLPWLTHWIYLAGHLSP